MAKWIRNKYDEVLSYESLMRAHKLSWQRQKLRREVILFSLKEEEYIKYCMKIKEWNICTWKI